MKVLTEEEQVQQGAFLWGATPADSQVGLSLSLGLWILMMVQWSRYANLQCSFSPVSAEKSGCVRICNLSCATPKQFFLICTLAPSLPLLVFPFRVSVSIPPLLAFHTSFLILFLYIPSPACLFLLSSPLSAYSPLPSHTSLSVSSCTLLTLSLMIDSALNIM